MYFVGNSPIEHCKFLRNDYPRDARNARLQDRSVILTRISVSDPSSPTLYTGQGVKEIDILLS
jgi:hypothetical protein